MCWSSAEASLHAPCSASAAQAQLRRCSLCAPRCLSLALRCSLLPRQSCLSRRAPLDGTAVRRLLCGRSAKAQEQDAFASLTPVSEARGSRLHTLRAVRSRWTARRQRKLRAPALAIAGSVAEPGLLRSSAHPLRRACDGSIDDKRIPLEPGSEHKQREPKTTIEQHRGVSGRVKEASSSRFGR